MQKVKVQRYISGKRPEYATKDVSDGSSNDEDYFENRKSIVIGKVRDVGQEEDEER
jgi:glutaredoxin